MLSALAGVVGLRMFTHYRMEPIVEGTNYGAPLNAASTPELAQVKHMMYEQQSHLLALEKELKEEKAKVSQLEVNNRDLSSGVAHLVLYHIGPTEKAPRDITSSPLISSSPISQGSEWLIVPEEGENKRSTLLTFPVIHKAEVEEASSGGGGSSSSFGGSDSGWFTPERHSLSFKGSRV